MSDLERCGIVLPEPEPHDAPPLSDEDMEALLFDDEPPPEAWRALAEQRGALLAALVAIEPFAYDHLENEYCVYCGSDAIGDDTLLHHRDHCPWLDAKRAMGGR